MAGRNTDLLLHGRYGTDGARKVEAYVSDNPEVPRIEFGSTGVSMNMEQAKARFEEILRGYERDWLQKEDEVEVNIVVTLRPCDCAKDISGRDSGCPLHGDEA